MSTDPFSFNQKSSYHTSANSQLTTTSSSQSTSSPHKTDLQAAKLFAQGITLVADMRHIKTESETLLLLKKAEKLFTQAELISKEIQRLGEFLTDLQNPEIPNSLLVSILQETFSKKLKQTIDNCLMTVFPQKDFKELWSNPRFFLQMKNIKGKTVFTHYLDEQQGKLAIMRELADLYTKLSKNTMCILEEEECYKRISELKRSKPTSQQFNLHYILNEGIQQLDSKETVPNILKLQHLQDFYTFLISPGYSKEFIVARFKELHIEIKTALGEAVWAACYKPNELFFADHFIFADPHVLLNCKDARGNNVIIQLMEHYKSKILLQRIKPEILDFEKKLKNTFSHQEQLHLFHSLPDVVKSDLMHLVWLEDGGKHNPHFGDLKYGENKLSKNPLILIYKSSESYPSILEIYLKTLDCKIKFDIQHAAHSFTNQQTLSTKPVDCSIKQLKLPPNFLKEQLPQHPKVAMVTAEFAGVISMGGLAPAVAGMSRALGSDHVCVILPKYDVINPKIPLQEKHQIQFNGKIHKVFKAKVNGITCFFIEHKLFNVGRDEKGNPNSIYEKGTDIEVKRRWIQFQSLSVELLHKLSTKEKNPVQLIHVHDAQTALVPKLYQTRHFEDWKQGKTPATVFTFHNNNSPLPYDYSETQALLTEVGLPSTPLNSFVSGLEDSDMNTTVSETFAKEVQTDLFGKGMQRYTKIHASTGKTLGIVNGNTEGWNPKTDLQLKNWVSQDGIPMDLTYGPEDKDLPQKIKLIRSQLVEYLKFHNLAKIDPTKPIFFYVGRYDAYQKGIDKLPVVMEEALANGAQFICIGIDPDKKAQEILQKMKEFAKKKNHNGVCIICDFKRADGRLHWQQGNASAEDSSGVKGFGSLLRAAVDVGVFPSIFEPCGLVQGEMHMMGIETLATATGGFVDTIFVEGPHQNGYLFKRELVWESKEQDDAIRKMVQHVCQRNHDKLDALYHDDEDRLAPYIAQKCVIMQNAAKSTWTSTFDDSLSPIDRIRLAYFFAFQRQKKRGEIALDLHALGSPHCQLANLAANYKNGFCFSAELYKTLGAHYDKNSKLTTFSLYAPHAKKITLNLTAKDTTEYSIQMQKDENGIWKARTNHALPGRSYHFLIEGPQNENPVRKIDPFAFENYIHKRSGEHESKVCDIDRPFPWTDEKWMNERVKIDPATSPVSIYEVHVSSWKKKSDGNPLNWKELAHELGSYCKEMGYSHLELMALFEHPQPISMGYQITNFYALNSRMGSIDDFCYFVNFMHEQGIGLIADWVPAHFAIDEFALSNLDGTPLLEDDNPDFAFHPLWGTKEFDFKKQFTKDFLASSLDYILNTFHLDGVRVDAVQSLLYINADRAPGTRINHKGGEINLEAKAFLKDLNTYVHQKYPGVLMIAEESSGFPNLTRSPKERGIHTKKKGIGFDLTWHMGFMNDTLQYMSMPDSQRSSSYSTFTNTVQSIDGNEDCRPRGKVVLAFSHDESANGKGTIFTKMAGNSDAEKFANGRLLLAYQALRGGGPILDFMGNEILQTQEWHGRLIQSDQNPAEKNKPAVQWEELDPTIDIFNSQYHRGAQESRKAILHLYKDNPGLHNQTNEGFRWIDATDSNNGVLSFHRRGNGQQFACIFNSSHKDLKDYHISLPNASYAPELDKLVAVKEVYNTDAVAFGGLGRENGSIEVIRDSLSKRPTHLKLRLPPYTALVLEEQFS